MNQHKAFVPLSIAILTVSDTRTEETDTSGQTLAARLVEAGHRLAGLLAPRGRPPAA